jgi:orotidine-5'-phosphate decarboxylase
MTFQSRFDSLADTLSPFCVGLDPSRESLTAAGLPDDVEAVTRFATAVVEAAAGRTAVLKPQMAFFERFGPDGLRALQRAGDMARDRGLLLLLDGKRGDIGTTCAGYAASFFGPKSAYRADAVTALAYMGFAALAPLTDAAATHGGAVFTVVMSSNPEGETVQTARTTAGSTVAAALAEEIAALNGKLGAPVAGAVLGATKVDQLAPLIKRLAGAPVLAPGLGAQGGSFAALASVFQGARRTLIPTMSRGVLAKGFSDVALRDTIGAAAAEAAAFRRGA